MRAPDPPVHVHAVVDELVRALEATVLLAEYLQLAASASAQDATALTRSLRRATDALEKLRALREPTP